MPSKLLINMLLAAAIGFVLSEARLPPRIPGRLGEVRRGHPKVLDVPALEAGARPNGQGPAGGDLVMVNNPQSPPSEAYRILRTNLQFASIDEPVRTLLVTSADPSEGKTLTVANLAVALAQSGRRVVILDCDMHRPRLHRVFNAVNNVGVTSALLRESLDPTPFLQRTDVPNLRVMTTGPLPPNSAELLGSQRMHTLLTELRAQADFVLVDSPPVLALSDAPVISTQVDGVLLVVHAGRTRRETLKRAQAVLRQVNANLVGVLLNRVSRRSKGYYYYYSHHYSKRYRNKYYRRDTPARFRAAAAVRRRRQRASSPAGVEDGCAASVALVRRTPAKRRLRTRPCRKLIGRAAMKRILVVCTANVCRSPMIAALLRNRFARAGLGDRAHCVVRHLCVGRGAGRPGPACACWPSAAST